MPLKDKFAVWLKTSYAQRHNCLLGLALVLLGAMVYANSFPGDFFIDDAYIVVDNPLVASIDLRAIFTTDYWGPEAKQALAFRPLTILSLAVNRQLT